MSVHQPPGPRNALGHLKINFPNPFHVYLHDTPDKHLFAREQHAYSSGCMRVQNPDQFAAQVLSIGGADGNYTPARLTSMYGTDERSIALTSRVPIHLVYMNTYVSNRAYRAVQDDLESKIQVESNRAYRAAQDDLESRIQVGLRRPVFTAGGGGQKKSGTFFRD